MRETKHDQEKNNAAELVQLLKELAEAQQKESVYENGTAAEIIKLTIPKEKK